MSGRTIYTYVNGNPVSFVDPNGLDAVMNSANRAAGLQPDSPKQTACESDCRKCKMKWLSENYSEAGAHAMQEFSVFSYIDSNRRAKTFALTAVGVASKVGFVKAVSATAAWTEGSAAAGAAAGATTATALTAVFGNLLPMFSTTAEIYASNVCGCEFLD